MAQSIRFGLAGVGRGTSLLKIAADDLGAEPVAVCDLNLDGAKARELLEQYPGLQGFTDYEAMLDESELDMVMVATPPITHGPLAAMALRRNIHTFSEIPLVCSVEQAEELWQANEQSEALFMTGANANFWAFVEAAVDLKNKGLLGEPYYAEAEYVHDIRSMFEQSPWRRTMEPITYCTHSLGPLLRWIDEDLASVSCFDTGGHVRGAADEHDAMVAHFRTPSDVVVRLLTSFINNAPAEHQYRLFGTKGYFARVCLPGQEPRTFFRSTEPCESEEKFVEIPDGELRPEYADVQGAASHGGADYAMLDHFIRAIRESLPSPVSLREGLRMTLPGVYAAESAKRGGEVLEIRYPWS